jgi:hypothetical protein
MKLFFRHISIIFCAVIFLAYFLLNSCIKEEFDSSNFDASQKLTPGLAFPVGYSHLSIDKYLDDTTLNEVHIDSDGFIRLIYSEHVISGSMSDLITLDDINISRTITNQSGSTINVLAGGTYDFTDSVEIPVSLGQTTADIERILIRSGNLRANITSAGLNGSVTFHFPGVTLNGIPLTITRGLPDPGFTQTLANYTLSTQQDNAGNNFIKCVLSVHLLFPAGPIPVGSTIFNFSASFNGLDYETIWASFGSYDVTLPPFRFTTTVFDQIAQGYFEFEDPKLKFVFSNSIGVPLGLSFSRLDATNRINNTFSLTGTGIPSISNPKIINYPSLNQIGQSVSDSLVIGRANSNLPAFLSNRPSTINIDAVASLNPSGGSGLTFINHDSEYEVNASLELPLWGKAGFLVLLDTLTFDYLNTALPVPEELDRVIIRVNITNSFPVALYPQVYLLDENRILLDSLFTGNEKVDGAIDTNSDGIADPLEADPIDIDLPRSKIEDLRNTRYLLTKGKIITTGFPAGNVKFYSSAFLDYNIGIIAQLKINTGTK